MGFEGLGASLFSPTIGLIRQKGDDIHLQLLLKEFHNLSVIPQIDLPIGREGNVIRTSGLKPEVLIPSESNYSPKYFRAMS